MCGVAGFLSNVAWQQQANLDWLGATVAQLANADATAEPQLAAGLAGLAARFDELMQFSTHLAVAQQPALRQQCEQLADILQRLEAGVLNAPPGNREQLGRHLETLRDYQWQLRAEVLNNVDRTLALLPPTLAPTAANRAQHFVAWGIEQVLENLDRLEVRGRDSAGVVVQLMLPPGWSPTTLPAAQRDDLDRRGSDAHAETGGVLLHTLADGRTVCRFVYKVANLIGKLGDNGANLRAAIRHDALLWAVAPAVQTLGILAHTRWASNGIINLANCHPVNASLADDPPGGVADSQIVAVLNGDVDNYQQLVVSAVESRKREIPSAIRTDAKIIPILFRLDTMADQPPAERVLAVVRRLEGSLAIGLLHPDDADHLYLAQKGSGQSLFVARVNDGWIVASEVYGLAARARQSLPLVQVGRGGIQVTLTGGTETSLSARLIDDAEAVELLPETIEIFSRDIFRGQYAYYLEKEIHEAPSSVRKTLQGRYAKAGRSVRFDVGEQKDLLPLIGRLNDPTLPPLRRIIVTGQGTAAIAAMGIAHLIRQALDGTPMVVDAAKASELSTSFDGKRSLKDLLVVAISQSGTTTDTNRTVDLARAQGAWVHAIVNRRNSPLGRKADSRLFTSDGRDVEMAVASTKAFYSQVAAGKLTALCLGQALGTLGAAQIYDELLALESLPERIQQVLAEEATIAACAGSYAPYNRYWALVGNGPNKIAAEEIRIKLSELCYRSIPCDFTEDKKHIDLSTEPLTLVIANDLPQLMAQDTAKEVAIFKAHNGKPIVFAAVGETCFEPYAEAAIYLPSVGAGLDFVLAAVAGHVWGFHAARAIDQTSVPFRQLAAALSDSLEAPAQADLPGLREQLSEILAAIAEGTTDAALPPRVVARLGNYLTQLQAVGADREARAALFNDGIAVMKLAYDELSRPIDSIRHQAKTVTVGISRPQKDIAPVVRRALAELEVTAGSLAERDRQFLIALSPFIAAVEGGAMYRIVDKGHEHAVEEAPAIQITRKIGASLGRDSSYEQPHVAAGSKRRTLRLGRALVSTGPGDNEQLLMIPLFDEQAWTCESLALLHLGIIPQASLQQKIALLKDTGQYEDAFEAFQEVRPADNFAAFLESTSPHDLIFTPSFRVLFGSREPARSA